MKILVACEESQRVTTEFRKLGHEAYSCDILPCSGGHPEWHLQQDVIPLLEFVSKKGVKKRQPKWYFDALSLSPAERASVRSKTFPGIARAMAEQWGKET